MKSPPTASRHDSSTTSSLASFLLPDDACPYYYSAPHLPPLRLPECMKRAVVGCAITLSTLQHASLLLSIELSSSSSASASSSSSTPTARSAASPLSLAVVLLLASTAVSLGTLGFLARTRRVWPSVLAFALHLDVLALTLALNYGIASEFFAWLAWVPVLLFLVGAPRCAFAAVCGLFLQGFVVHFITASAGAGASSSSACSPASTAPGQAIELTPGTKLVCCGLSLMAVAVIALLLYSPPPPPRQTAPKLQLDQFPSSSSSSSSSSAAASADPKAQLLAHIGQEIKAPLHGILSLAAQVVDSLPSRLWIEKECVRRIVDSGHVMLCIMDNLLDFPAISTSQLRLQHTLFSIVDEFNQVLSILKPSAFKKQITLESTVDVRYPQRFGDPKRFRQVLFNVASNAIKYSPEKGCVRLYLTNTRLNCNRIEVRVEDTGVGISGDLIPHLFELPHLDESMKKSLPGGPGLSLAVSKLLCEAMNVVGKGSTFTFSVDIPMHEEAAQEYVRSKSADSLSLRRKSEGAEPVVVDNKDALLACADRRWARRHSLATSSSSASSSTSSSPRKRRPTTQSLPRQTSQPRRQRANSLKSQAQPQGHDHSSSVPSASSRSRRHSNGNVDDRDTDEAGRAAPELDLYNNGGSGGGRAGATRAVSASSMSSSAVPVRAMSEDELMANTTATAAAGEKAATDRRGGSVIVMSSSSSSSSSRSGDRARDKEQKKLQELYQRLQGTRVLVVEDNVVNQKVAKLMLTSLGCEVAIASNGQIGLDLMAQRADAGAGEAFDVVLMDLQMPVMDGFIASTRIRERERAEKRPRTPIVTLTASTTSEYQERCTACGMDGWLSKPFSKEQLATVIATWTHKYPVSTPSSSSSSSSSSESETPSSPEFSPPSDDGFDAVPADQNATAEPAATTNTAGAATGQTDHTHDSPQRHHHQIKQLRAETAAMPIPSSASAEHLASTHHFAAAAAERSNLHRSSSA